MAYVTLDVDVDLDMFSTDDLIDELENRREFVPEQEQLDNIKEIVERIYKKYQSGDLVQKEFHELFYEVLGKIV